MKGNINMKLRKILCLSLAAAVTFTSAINLTVSAQIGGESVTPPNNEFEMSAIIQKQILKNDHNFEENENNITPYYAVSVHNAIINEAMNGAEAVGKELKDVYWNDMRTICNNCDNWYPGNATYSSAIHGNRNYYATLKYLWTYALKISKSSTLSLSQQCDKVANECLALFDCNQFEIARGTDGVTDYNFIHCLGNVSKDVLSRYGNKSDYTGDKVKYRKFLIFGVIMHYFGDLAAHRTRVSQVLIDRMSDSNYANSQNKFTRSDFSASEWTRLTSRIQAKTLDYTNIIGLLDANNKSNDRIKYIRNRYEDNVKVIPSRLSEAKLNAYWFMQHYLEGYNAGILAPVYNIDYIYADKYYQATW